MPEIQRQKDLFRLNRGLNTESNEINFPDGFTVDEQNYELLIDGSRRRRKGLARESGGALFTAGPTIAADTSFVSYRWRNVNGDPSINFIVHQIGHLLFFTDDAETVSTTYHPVGGPPFSQFNVFDLRIDKTLTETDIGAKPCQFSRGRGHLFLSHPNIPPQYISFDPDTNLFEINEITILVRDFDGIDDGVPIDLEPTGAITNTHRYNLRNRGWKQNDMNQYSLDKGRNPSKNMLWFRGYRRQTDVNYADEDGIQAWNSDKIEVEAFSNASAPQGSLFLNPLDTRFAAVSATGGVILPIDVPLNGFIDGNGITGGRIRLEIISHGQDDGDTIDILGSLWYYQAGGQYYSYSYDGLYTLGNTVPDSPGEAQKIDDDNIEIFVPQVHSQWSSWFSTAFDGTMYSGEALTKPDGKRLLVGPSSIEFHAGRIFYAGIEDQEWADTIFFSQVAIKPNVYGAAHQRFDPTDEEFNGLFPDDGGTIVIPGIGRIQALLSIRDVLLVFADNGVWEIGGGQRGYFSADGYSLRKITEDECTSPYSPIVIGNQAMFTGTRGIFAVAPNEFTGALESQNISEDLVQTLWNDIPTTQQAAVRTVYDEALKRIYFLYGDTGDNINQYANALILDGRVSAWYKFKFNVSPTSAIVHAYTITDADASNSNKKVKWTVQATDDLETCDLDQIDFIDYDGAESPLPFMLTGHDNLGDFQRRRQAPQIMVYQRRTETGFVDDGQGGLDPVNESSCFMTARWDWTDDAIAGKFGSDNEVYRHVRGFQPAGPGAYEDGYPLVVTRNKVRGRGRVLQLKFEGKPEKDTHLLGFTINYKISRMK